MLNLSLDKCIKILIILGLCITPFLNYVEVLALMRGELESQSIIYTPIQVKLLKDIIMLFFIFILLLKNFKGTSTSVVLAMLLLITLLNSNMLFSVIAGNESYIIFGLRWFYPLLIVFLGYKIINNKHFDRKFDFFFVLIFSIHFLMQIIQFFSGIEWFGLFEGYSLRNPGIFLIPNTAAFFSVIVLYWFMYEFKGNMIVDSTYGSILGNLGLIVFIIVVVFLLYLAFKAYLKMNKPKLSFISIVLLFSLTTIILEAYPINFF